jgi:hypothetical protein
MKIKQFKFALIFFIAFNSYSQTNLFNKDGSYRRDGYYLFKGCTMKFRDYFADNDKGVFKGSTTMVTESSHQLLSKAGKNPEIAVRFLKNGQAFFIMSVEENRGIGMYLRSINNIKEEVLNRADRKSENGVNKINIENLVEGDKSKGHEGYRRFLYFNEVSNINGIYEMKLENSILKNIKSTEKFTVEHEYKLEKGKLVYNFRHNNQTISCNNYDVEFVEFKELEEDYRIIYLEEQKLLAEKTKKDEEAKRLKAQKDWEIQQEKNRLAAIEFEKNRQIKLKSANVGDRICFSQDWTHSEKSSGFFGFGSYENKTEYKMMIICYIERKEGTKMQVRVANIESSNRNQYSTPDYKGVKMTEGSIHWVNPFTDTNWLFCE